MASPTTKNFSSKNINLCIFIIFTLNNHLEKYFFLSLFRDLDSPWFTTIGKLQKLPFKYSSSLLKLSSQIHYCPQEMFIKGSFYPLRVSTKEKELRITTTTTTIIGGPATTKKRLYLWHFFFSFSCWKPYAHTHTHPRENCPKRVI